MRPVPLQLAAILFLLSPTLVADTFTGKVVKVVDGDTVEVLDPDGIVYRVCLASTAAPLRSRRQCRSPPFARGAAATVGTVDPAGNQGVSGVRDHNEVDLIFQESRHAWQTLTA